MQQYDIIAKRTPLATMIIFQDSSLCQDSTFIDRYR